MSLPLSYHTLPFERIKVFAHGLIKIKLGHIQPDYASLKDAISNYPMLSEKKDWKPELVGHSRFDVGPWSCQPLAIYGLLTQIIDVSSEAGYPFLNESAPKCHRNQAIRFQHETPDRRQRCIHVIISNTQSPGNKASLI